MDYSRIRSYFEKRSNTPGCIIAIAALIGLGLLASGSPTAIFFGVLFLAAAIISGVLFFSQKGISDEEIDRVCLERIKDIEDKGLKKLNLEKEQVSLIKPIVVHGPYYSRIQSQPLYKVGNDGVGRSSNYKASVLFFSDEQVFSYSLAFSIISDEKKTITDEYFYKDIVSVSTSDEVFNYKDNIGNQININFQLFKLTTSGGTSISNSIMSLDDYVEKSIQGMKQLLRQKKQS